MMVRAKRKLSKNYVELFKNINSDISNYLIKCDNGSSVEKLSLEERKKLWLSCIQIIVNSSQDEGACTDETISNLLELLYIILCSCNFAIENENEFINLLTHINSNSLYLKYESVHNNISLINEYWLCKKSEKTIPGMEYYALQYLLGACSSDKPLTSDIQRLNAIRKVMTSAPFETAVPSLRPLLLKLVQSQIIVNSDNGQRFLAQALILSQRVMLDIHRTILLELESCMKKKAASYAKVYVTAWQNAKGETRNLIEKNCFQHIMELFLKEQRTSLELTKVGHNLLAVLDIWHSERKKKNADFISMITDCYQPFIWKYLESGFNVHRVNAVDLLLKAFPLQRPGDDVMQAERLFNQQFAAMVSALRDDCHIVRIIAVREVCNILSHYWNSFTPVQIQKLLTIISMEDALDASTADVRRMVYVGFQSFLNNPLSVEYLKQIIPAMSDNIHDVNQKVRISFIQLLIAVKEKNDPILKYSDLVPSFSLYYRLAEDNIKVGQLIVKLLLNSYYREGMPVLEWLKRFIFLIKTYPRSYRNFFLYSEKDLPFSDAFTIMQEIVEQVGNYVMSKSAEGLDTENEDVPETQKNKRKPGRSKKPLRSLNVRKNNESVKEEDNAKAKECAFDDPAVVEGLFDVVTILWVLHDNRLNKPENQDKRLKFFETYIKYAQALISYYRDSNLFCSVLCLSGNIPSSLLRSNSITLPGYCIKMLKSNQIDSSDQGKELTLSMLVALTKWGKGCDVLEQVMLWLDAAFETQNMNSSILPRKRVRINETIQPNSIVAIQLLDMLMKTEYVKMSILKKNYVQLFELWNFMSRIKKIIETRLEQGEPYEDDLMSDEFLKVCFRRYAKLIPLLKDRKSTGEGETGETGTGNELSINYQEEMEGLIQWAEDVLYPLLQDSRRVDADVEDISLVTSIYRDILYVSDNLIILHVVNRRFHLKLSHLILKLMETDYGLYFVKSASRLAAAINYSGKLLFNVNDDLQIFSKVVPCIVSSILNVFTCRELSDEEIELITADVPEIKHNLGKILDTYQDNFKLRTSSRETLRQLQMLISLFQDAILALLSKEITSQLPSYSNIAQFPAIASAFVSLFYKRKFRGPMFVHVLNATLSAKVYEPRSVLACVVLLHFYANHDQKINKIELRKTVSSASSVLSAIASGMDNRETDADDTPETGDTDASVNKSRKLPKALIEDGLTLLSQIQNTLDDRRGDLDEM